MNTQGTRLLSTSFSSDHISQLVTCEPYIRLLERARHVNNVFQLDADVPAEWCEEDYQDIEELYALVTTGKYEFQHRWDFSCTIEHMPPEIKAAFPGGNGTFSLSHSESTYKVLRKSIDFAEVRHELREWRDAIINNIFEDGEERSSLTLLGCKRKYVWPRFAAV